MSDALVWIRGRVRPLLAEKLGITTVLTACFAVCWFVIPRHVLVTPHTLPQTGVERAWPLVEGWAAVYLSIGLFNVAAPYLTIARPLLHRHARGFTTITAISFAVFALFPVEVPVPVDRATTVLYGLLLSDTRLNAFPSLHAGYTVYGLLYWAHVLPDIPSPIARRVTAALMTAWAAALMLSVLFLKQHYLADLAAGGVLAALVYGYEFARAPRARLRRRPAHRPDPAPLAPREESPT